MTAKAARLRHYASEAADASYDIEQRYAERYDEMLMLR
jgi:hypothetical protein